MTRTIAFARPLALGAAVVALVGALAVTVLVNAAPTAHAAPGHGAIAARSAFHDAMRKLWEDHIVWTRQFIVSAATTPETLPDIAATTERLLANQTHIGDALAPFYGEAAGDQVTALLRDHILTAAELVQAAKAGDTAAVDAAAAAWYANADQIAAALHSLNPAQWPIEDLRAHMREHLDLTLEEAVARLEGRYADDIAAYDRIHVQILEMADMLSDGIVAQFPGRFAR